MVNVSSFSYRSLNLSNIQCQRLLRIQKSWGHSYRHIHINRVLSSRLYEDLVNRKLIQHVSSPDLENILSEQNCTVYCGFDPTASSLHLGHLFSLVTLLRFHKHGHQAIALVGGATGLIGDPSGRRSERPEMPRETLLRNQEELESQMTLFFDRAIGTSGSNSKPMVMNNISWLGSMSLIDFITQTGRHARLASMLARDSVKSRLESVQGLSFTEFAYQLFQAHDFWHLYKEHKCSIQIGGGDQWGNIVAGIDLIHRREGNNSKVFGLTTPLLTTSTGEKIGKSAGNALWLNPNLTSPYQFYQYFMKMADSDVLDLLLRFTFLDIEEINAIYSRHMANPEKLEAQRSLARAVTKLVHGESGLAAAEAATAALFDPTKIASLNFEQMDKGFPVQADTKDLVISLPKSLVANQPINNIAHLSGLTKSKGEATRLIKNNGLYLNHNRVTKVDQLVTEADLVAEGWGLILRSGKSNYRLVRVTI